MKIITSQKIKLLTGLLFLFAAACFVQGEAIAKVSQGTAPEGKSSSSSDAGFERTKRNGNEGSLWAWGTMGHGSYDQTIDTFKKEGEFFNPEKDVATYTQGRTRYKVFTYSKVNYVQVDYGWGGVFLYTTR